MPSRRQVWYYEPSPVARLLRPLGEHYTLRAFPRRATLARSHPKQQTLTTELIVGVADLERDNARELQQMAGDGERFRLIGLVGAASDRMNGGGDADVFAFLPRRVPAPLLERTIAAAFENLELALRERAAREELARTEQEMEELNRIGVALSSERDINALLNLILAKSRQVTNADAGSLYLVEEVAENSYQLRFKLTHNDSISFPFQEFTMPMTEQSMAGYVALHGEVINLPDAYHIPPDKPYRFNAKFDQQTGYRTRSMLTLPLRNPKGEVLGVLQLINCKRRAGIRLNSPEAFEREVVPFSERAGRLAYSLASQAAVAYENNKLYADIERLFEGFVGAAVTAIEQRDPTTSGHSSRVCTLTVGLAEVLDGADTGRYAQVRFSAEQMKEIRYAALLHDFGKVGVREEVLVKAKKLYPTHLALLRQRFDYVRKELEARIAQEKVRCLVEKSRDEALKRCEVLEQEFRRRLAELDDYFEFILRVNEPTVLPAGNFEKLLEIAQQTFCDPRGVEHRLLTPEEVRFLSIPKGSLDPDERREIESHVIHTFNFLLQIPWTREIRGIPEIARYHHEFMNGKGYPYQISGEQIPLQTRMMTVCDIFDALSAADRPYKKAVPVERALDILDMMVKDNELDPDLFQLFLDAKVYELTSTRR